MKVVKGYKETETACSVEVEYFVLSGADLSYTLYIYLLVFGLWHLTETLYSKRTAVINSACAYTNHSIQYWH